MGKLPDKYRTLFVYVVLTVITLAVFWQVLHNEFVSYDDQQYVFENTHIQNKPVLQTIKWAFTSGHAANWHPLTWLSHTLDYKLFGLNPTGHHLTNLLLHIANAILLFAVLNAMTGSPRRSEAKTGALWQSAFVAALFALHPLHVESVAWVAERKDVLSTFFWFLTMAAYLRYTRNPNVRSYLLTLVLFAIGLMSKPMLVTLPFVLLLLDYWPLNRLEINNRRQIYHLVYEKIPFFILSAISSVITCVVQQHVMTDIETFPFNWRIANAVVSYLRYIEKTFVPHKLAVLYPLAGNIPTVGLITLSVVFLLVITILVIRLSNKRRYLLVGWLWFLGTLVPAIGIVQVGLQAIADRYTYVPLIGLFIIIAWGIVDILSSWRYRKIFLAGMAAVVLAALSACTILQLRYWHNSMDLFSHAVAVTNNNYICYDNLGLVLTNMGKFEQAIECHKKSIEIKPDYVEAINNLGAIYAQLGHHAEAKQVLSSAIKFKPDYAKAYYNLGVSYISLNQWIDAAALLERATKIEPDYPEALHNLGCAYSNLGRYNEAIDCFTRAIKIKPDSPESYNSLGTVYFKIKDSPQAIEAYKQAITTKHDYFEAWYNLGFAYLSLNRFTEAIEAYRHAITLKPDYADAQYKLGMAYLGAGDKNAALKQYDILRTLEPKSADKLLQLIGK